MASPRAISPSDHRALVGDTLAVIDKLTEGQLVLVGSSIGGWLMLLAARARPERVKALIGIAAAPDATEDLMWQRMSSSCART